MKEKAMEAMKEKEEKAMKEKEEKAMKEKEEKAMKEKAMEEKEKEARGFWTTCPTCLLRHQATATKSFHDFPMPLQQANPEDGLGDVPFIQQPILQKGEEEEEKEEEKEEEEEEEEDDIIQPVGESLHISPPTPNVTALQNVYGIQPFGEISPIPPAGQAEEHVVLTGEATQVASSPLLSFGGNTPLGEATQVASSPLLSFGGNTPLPGPRVPGHVSRDFMLKINRIQRIAAADRTNTSGQRSSSQPLRSTFPPSQSAPPQNERWFSNPMR